MFSIGDFARLGRVSVRMLRHYDELGLLRPAHVDPLTGYRYYHAAQLARLNRIIALKDLGFTLNRVQTILDHDLSANELQAMLQRRHAELKQRVRADLERLARVRARISTIKQEGLIPMNEIVIKRIPAVRVAEVCAIAAGYDPQSIAPVIDPLFCDLFECLARAGVAPTGPHLAYYEPVGEGVLVHAAAPIGDDVHHTGHDLGERTSIVELPEIEAATTIHRGSMDHADTVVQQLATWIEDHGYQGSGFAREVYLEITDDRNTWVTEFQEPIRKLSLSKPNVAPQG